MVNIFWPTDAVKQRHKFYGKQHRSVSWLDLKELWIQGDETRRVHFEVGCERATRTLVPISRCIQATVTLVERLQGETREAQPSGLYLGLLPNGEPQPANRQEVRGRAEVQINVGASRNDRTFIDNGLPGHTTGDLLKHLFD